MSARARADSPTPRPRAKIPARLDRRALEPSPAAEIVDAVSGPFERRIDATPPMHRRRRDR